MSSPTSETPVVMPRQTLQGHTDWVRGAVHLPGRRIITGSWDGSLRLWDLESGAQIGEDWRDEGEKKAICTIALSPIGGTVASGSTDGTVRLWDVETGKVIAKLTGHTTAVLSLCWSADRERVVSGSWDGTARVWNINSGETLIGPIKTGHESVHVVMYSPDETKIATGGHNEHAVKIWDAKTGSLLITLEHHQAVFSLVWTSNGNRLISASRGPIRIFDTHTWQQTATLVGHTKVVRAISLSQNNRLLASVSDDKTSRLWNLDTNLPVGPPLQQKHRTTVECAAFSADGEMLVTGGENNNVYVWDIRAILKEVRLEDLLLPIPDVVELIDTHDQDDQLSPDFYDDVRDERRCDGGRSSATTNRNRFTYRRGNHRTRRTLASSFENASVLLARISMLFHRTPSDIEATELQQRPRRSIFSRPSPRVIEVAAVRDRETLVVAPQTVTQKQRPHGQAQSSSQHAAASTSTTPLPTDANATNTNTTTPGVTFVRINLRSLLARFVLILCCVWQPPNADGR